MKSDKNGCAIVRPGQEEYEVFWIGPSYYLHYDYRALNHAFFTGIYRDLKTAREGRDKWLAIMGETR